MKTQIFKNDDHPLLFYMKGFSFLCALLSSDYTKVMSHSPCTSQSSEHLMSVARIGFCNILRSYYQ